MASDYLLQEDGVSKLILEDGSGFLLLETSNGGAAVTSCDQPLINTDCILNVMKVD